MVGQGSVAAGQNRPLAISTNASGKRTLPPAHRGAALDSTTTPNPLRGRCDDRCACHCAAKVDNSWIPVPISESDRRKIAYDNAKALYKPWESTRVVNPNPAET
jgi:hypothetical protein